MLEGGSGCRDQAYPCSQLAGTHPPRVFHECTTVNQKFLREGLNDFAVGRKYHVACRIQYCVDVNLLYFRGAYLGTAKVALALNM